jgi:membrane AbrB-like protein
MRRAAEWLVLIGLASALAATLTALHIPAAFLLGPMIAAIAMSVSGAQVKLPRLFVFAAQAILGCLIAAAINANLLHIVAAHWAIFVGLSLATMLITALLGLFITRGGWLPGTTAIWGLSPGAASAMVLLADDHGADQRMVAVMQYSRIALVAVAAILVARALGPPAAPVNAIVAGGTDPHWWTLPPLVPCIETLALAASAAAIAIYFRKASAALFLPAFVGAALQGAGLIEIAVPQPLATLAFCSVGVYVGLSFTRAALLHSLRMLPKMLVAIVAMIALCGLLSLLLTKLLPGMDPLTAYLAMSPGGIDAAVIIAASTNVSLPLILAAQFVRLFFVIAGAPLLAKWLATWHRQSAPGPNR